MRSARRPRSCGRGCCGVKVATSRCCTPCRSTRPTTDVPARVSFRIGGVINAETPQKSPHTDMPGLGTLTMPETDARPVPRLSHGDGDHERFAHYAPKDKIVEASV